MCTSLAPYPNSFFTLTFARSLSLPRCFVLHPRPPPFPRKVATRNGLTQHEVMVTAGANQAVLNAVIALVDEGDAVVLFK
jgi:hypothetical protein